MADNNRNWSNQSNQSHQNWEQNRNRLNEEDEKNRNRENYGDIGYGDDYNRNQGMRTGYSNKGYSGDSARGREIENQGEYGSIGNSYGEEYGNDYGSQYGNQQRNFHNGGGQQGWQNSGSNENRYRQNDWKQGNQYQSRQDWGRGRVNTGNNSYENRGYGSDYGSQYGAEPYKDQRDRNYNMYGGDTSNYGNANQGGYDRGWWDRTRDEVSSWFGDENAERRRMRDQQRSGGYRGKGPKEYQRSEDRIREDVCDRLTDDDMLDATNINVQVQGNEVVLTGTVNNRDQKRRAEDVIESISGVRNVENRIRVENNDGRNDMR